MHEPQGTHVSQEEPCLSVACRSVVVLPFLDVSESSRRQWCWQQSLRGLLWEVLLVAGSVSSTQHLTGPIFSDWLTLGTGRSQPPSPSGLAWKASLALLLPGYGASGQLLKLSEPRFLHC